MTLRVLISYAVGLALAASLAACSTGDAAGAGADPTTGVTSASTTTATSPAPPETSGSPSPATSSPVAKTPDGRTLEVTVTGRQIDPAPSTVSLGVGDRLTLVVTSDHDDTLHIHGFDIEKPLAAGRATSVTLTGTQPGVYEVETHHPELRLLKIAVK